MVSPETCKKGRPSYGSIAPGIDNPETASGLRSLHRRHLAGLVPDIAGRVTKEWIPDSTALSDGPSAVKVAEAKAYDTGDAVGDDRAYTYAGPSA
jgi:hypothetical protein